jgi:sec-independent protein translocase protein TatC
MSVPQQSASTPTIAPSQGDGSPYQPLPGVREPEPVEMSFIDHLEELRWALIKGFSGVVIVTIVCAFFSKWIIDVLLLGPSKADFFMYRLFGMDAINLELLNRTITGQFFAHIGTVLAVGVIVGSPIFVFYLWKFIEPGLYPSEKRGLRFSAVFATFFFMLGISFGYLVISPIALQFFANYTISDAILNQFDITRYFSMITMWSFGAGLLFELPVVIYFLTKMGLLTSAWLRQYRRISIVVILVCGAMFTPPDPFSQILVAVPLMLLYEMSVLLAERVERKRERDLAASLAGGTG